MKRLLLAGAMPLALLAAPARAQHATISAAPAGYAPETTSVVLPATSTPLAGTATASTVTPSSGNASIASGTSTIGPFTPQLGRDIVLKLWTPDAAAFTCQLFNSIDGGTTKLPLTIFDTQIGGPYTAPVNSAIVAETVAGTTEWLVCTVTAGTLKYGVMN